MNDKFAGFLPSLSSPPTSIFSIVPDDDTDLDMATRAINVSTGGDVRITTVDGTTETVFIGAGIVFPIRASRIWATGTDATGIRGLS